jgi:DNA-binding HxlR family transcriptional regulator
LTEDVDTLARRLALLGNPIRLMVLLSLYSSNYMRKSEHSLRHSEIKELIGIPDESSLNYHLRELERANVISKEAIQDQKGEVYPLYHITPDGKKTLEEFGLLKILDERLKKMSR